jgi:hypothetical protein
MGVARRWYAYGAVASIIIGGVALAVAVAALPQPWTHGYVSEAGIAGRAGVYRFGILAWCAGLILLAGAAGRTVAGALFALAGLVGTLSAAVTCSAGCPLPPYADPHPRDLVHAGAAIAAIGLAVLGLLWLSVAEPTDRRVRRRARIGMIAVAPLLALMVIGLLAAGRSTLTAVTERAVLIALLATLGAVATALGAGGGSSAVPLPREARGYSLLDRRP